MITCQKQCYEVSDQTQRLMLGKQESDVKEETDYKHIWGQGLTNNSASQLALKCGLTCDKFLAKQIALKGLKQRV